MLGFTQTTLERVMQMEVVISLVPQTPKTDKLISAGGLHHGPQLQCMWKIACCSCCELTVANVLFAEMIALMKPGCAFVNVSRGAVVDTDALVARLQQGQTSQCPAILPATLAHHSYRNSVQTTNQVRDDAKPVGYDNTLCVCVCGRAKATSRLGWTSLILNRSHQTTRSQSCRTFSSRRTRPLGRPAVAT